MIPKQGRVECLLCIFFGRQNKLYEADQVKQEVRQKVWSEFKGKHLQIKHQGPTQALTYVKGTSIKKKKTQLTELCDAMWRNKTFRCWNAALLCFGRQSLDILDLES